MEICPNKRDQLKKNTMQATLTQLQKNWPSIDWTKIQRAETMIGPEFWKPKRFGEQLAMGRCVRFFTEHNMLPKLLEVANPGKKGKRLYRLK